MKRNQVIVLSILLTSLAAVIVLLFAVGERRARNAVSAAELSRDQKLWCLAACAVLTQRNQDRHDILGATERTDANINSWMEGLSEAWGIEDKNTLFESLRWIEQGGHRRGFVELAVFLSSAGEQELKELESRSERDPELKNRIEIVRKHFAKLAEKSLAGWDYSRYLSLCSWGYLVGYLSEDEAWRLMLPAARILQDTFDSWEDLGANYLIGREFWSLRATQKGGDQYVHAYEWLCSDPESPWLNIPWDLDLGTAHADEGVPANRSP